MGAPANDHVPALHKVQLQCEALQGNNQQLAKAKAAADQGLRDAQSEKEALVAQLSDKEALLEEQRGLLSSQWSVWIGLDRPFHPVH
jgi:hypothetical protein